jgi:hypothetical protein
MVCPTWGCLVHLQKKQTKEGERERRPMAHIPRAAIPTFPKTQGAWSVHLQALWSTENVLYWFRYSSAWVFERAPGCAVGQTLALL